MNSENVMVFLSLPDRMIGLELAGVNTQSCLNNRADHLVAGAQKYIAQGGL